MTKVIILAVKGFQKNFKQIPYVQEDREINKYNKERNRNYENN